MITLAVITALVCSLTYDGQSRPELPVGQYVVDAFGPDRLSRVGADHRLHSVKRLPPYTRIIHKGIRFAEPSAVKGRTSASLSSEWLVLKDGVTIEGRPPSNGIFWSQCSVMLPCLLRLDEDYRTKRIKSR